jgi:hypothetical protein
LEGRNGRGAEARQQVPGFSEAGDFSVDLSND